VRTFFLRTKAQTSGQRRPDSPHIEELDSGNLRAACSAVHSEAIFPARRAVDIYVPGTYAELLGEESSGSPEPRDSSRSPISGTPSFPSHEGTAVLPAPSIFEPQHLGDTNEQLSSSDFLQMDASLDRQVITQNRTQIEVPWLEEQDLDTLERLAQSSIRAVRFNRHPYTTSTLPVHSGSSSDSQLAHPTVRDDGERAWGEILGHMHATNANVTGLPFCESPVGLENDLDNSREDALPRAVLRWEPVNEESEQLVVDLHGPNGVFVIPVEFPQRQRLEHAPEANQYAQRILEPQAGFRDSLDAAVYSGSNLPYDQLYQQELDWVTSRQEFVSGPARFIGIDYDPELPAPRNSNVTLPTTWTVVQRSDIPVDVNLSSLDWISGGILGEGTHSKVYLAHHKPANKEIAMKVTYMKRPLHAVVCQGIINELKVLEIISQQDVPLPFVLGPAPVANKWAWTSSEGFLHILTVRNSHCR
jgi:hypothetical protein